MQVFTGMEKGVSEDDCSGGNFQWAISSFVSVFMIYITTLYNTE